MPCCQRKDLLTKLKADAKSEASTKNFCDVEMKKATDNRDKAADNIEDTLENFRWVGPSQRHSPQKLWAFCVHSP